MNHRIGFDYSAYYEAKSKLPEPDGVHCVICGRNLPKYKRAYCSDECRAKWFASLGVKSWESIKWAAFRRDNYTCQSYGFHCLPHFVFQNGQMFLDNLNFPSPNSKLHGDHIVPIWKGGSEFDLANVQTLCEKCHRKKTKTEAKERTKNEQLVLSGVQKRLEVTV